MKKFLAALAAMATLLLPLGNSADAKETKVYKELKINAERTMVLKGSVFDRRTDPLVNKLYQLDADSNEPVWLILNSPGGSIEDGMRLISAMKAADSPIYCVVDSKAYSMAAVILQFCDYRIAQKYSDIMFHEASFGVRGSMSLVKSQVDHVMQYLLEFDQAIAQQLKMPLKTYQEKARNEWWLTARKAASAGVVDALVDSLIYYYEEPPRDPFSLIFGNEGYRDGMWWCGPEDNPDEPCYGKFTGRSSR